MKNPNELTEQDVRDFLAAELIRKAKQRAANARHKLEHPETDEQKAKRTAYNKRRNVQKKEFRAAMLQKAKDLGLA